MKNYFEFYFPQMIKLIRIKILKYQNECSLLKFSIPGKC